MLKKISVILPVYNEEKNIDILYNEIIISLKQINRNYEIIFINDGSKDNSYLKLLELSKKDKRIKIIKFRKNFGQTAAMDAGFKNASGDVIISLDSDLQNDPSDFRTLLNKLEQGYDVVSGWRKSRKDSFSKTIISFFANKFRRLVTKEKIHDSGCSLKAYRSECLKNLNLYGEMHRYITTLLAFKGYKITEVIVNHRSRKFGKTKYKIARVMNGLLDLLFIKFWNDYSARPIHFFGFFAFAQYFLAFLLFLEQIIKAIITDLFNVGPILLLSVMLIITGTLTFFFGFIAEILIRTYYKNESNYDIEKII